MESFKTHQLESLYARIVPMFSDCNTDILAELDTMYIESRYPGEMGLMPHGKPNLSEIYGLLP